MKEIIVWGWRITVLGVMVGIATMLEKSLNREFGQYFWKLRNLPDALNWLILFASWGLAKTASDCWNCPKWVLKWAGIIVILLTATNANAQSVTVTVDHYSRVNCYFGYTVTGATNFVDLAASKWMGTGARTFTVSTNATISAWLRGESTQTNSIKFWSKTLAYTNDTAARLVIFDNTADYQPNYATNNLRIAYTESDASYSTGSLWQMVAYGFLAVSCFFATGMGFRLVTRGFARVTGERPADD